VAAKIGPIRPQSLKFSPDELERILSRRSPVPLDEPMEEENHHVTQLDEDEEGGEQFSRRMDTMDLLENPVAAFNGGGGSGGGNWLQLAMASKMMAFPRPPPRSDNEGSSDESGSLTIFLGESGLIKPNTYKYSTVPYIFVAFVSNFRQLNFY
jgi:hypothetical protein